MATTCTGKLNRVNSKKLASPRFFKPVVRPLVQGMKIPTAFMQRYGGDLKKVAVLKIPTGAEWRVAVCNLDGETWLAEGLEEFGKFYSIEAGYLIAFRYVGDSRFQVVIFDTTATEIDYPVKSHHEQPTDGNDDPTVILEDISNKSENVDNHENGENQNLGSSNGRRLRQRSTNGSGGGTPSKAPHHQSPMAKKKKVAEEERAPKSNSKYPCFTFRVRSTNVFHPRRVYVPIDFAKNNFGEENCKLSFELRLPESGKNSWLVRLSINGRRAQIYGIGWSQFVDENQLKLEDICIFELVKKKAFNVYIRS